MYVLYMVAVAEVQVVIETVWCYFLVYGLSNRYVHCVYNYMGQAKIYVCLRHWRIDVDAQRIANKDFLLKITFMVQVFKMATMKKSHINNY